MKCVELLLYSFKTLQENIQFSKVKNLEIFFIF